MKGESKYYLTIKNIYEFKLYISKYFFSLYIGYIYALGVQTFGGQCIDLYEDFGSTMKEPY